jgi:molybdopterin-containing oxidoreductase family membrane subunit
VPWRKKAYTILALGWRGSDRQWKNFTRAYLFLAALATPLVLSVHSVVSWDFAVSIVPGWHTTIFAPYFVAGAILSASRWWCPSPCPSGRSSTWKRI